MLASYTPLWLWVPYHRILRKQEVRNIHALLLLCADRKLSSFSCSCLLSGEGEGTIGVCEGIEDPDVKECTLSVILPESLCLDIDTCSILSVSGAVV